MSVESETVRMDPATAEAADWFARLEGGAATDSDWLAFEGWLAASPAHAAAYDRLSRLWVELDAGRAAILAGLDAAPIQSQPRRAARPRTPMISRRAWLGVGSAIAASVVVSAAGLGYMGVRQPAGVVYETANGETSRVVLADGTHIHLNAGSRITVRLGRQERRVQMAEGEATFDVAHDPQRPFLINAGDREVRVVGTEFNLRRRGGKIAVTVRRGIVDVRPNGLDKATPATRLVPGQQLLHEEGQAAQIVRVVEPDAAFGWTSGQLVYRDQPLGEVADDLSLRFATPVRTGDARTARLKFSGVLVLDDQAAVLRRLEAFLPVKAYRTADAIVLRAR